MIASIAGCLGLIIGSFLNVVILRHDERPMTGRSACMSCGRTLAWYELFPVISWLALRGRCRSCRAHISLQYPIVEASTGIVFALLAGAFFVTTPLFSYSALLIFPYFVVAALLIAITVYDFYYTIIPDEWVYLFAAVALLSSLFARDPALTPLLVLFSGPLVAAPLYALWAFSGGAWMGFGDVKFALGMGWLLGPIYGIAAVFLSFVIGAIVSVCVIIPLSSLREGGKRITMKSEVPFGPFLVASTFFLWLAALNGYDLGALFS